MSTENRNSINCAVNSFAQVIQGAANPVFRKTVAANTKGRFRNMLNKPADWFYGECYEAKMAYINWLKVFNEHRINTENRRTFCTKKHTYKQLIKRKRRLFEMKRIKTIENLRHLNPRDFWKVFSKKKGHSDTNLTIDDFHKCFSELSNDIEQVQNEEAETFCKNLNYEEESCTYKYPEHDKRISISEVKCAIKSLKRDKTAGSDNLVNEYFIEANDIIASHLVGLFQQYLNLVASRKNGLKEL